MWHGYDQTTQLMVDMIVEERLDQAERFRMVRQASTHRRGWVLRAGHWLLYRLGVVLVALGRRLQRCQVPKPASLESAEALGRG